MKYTNEQLGKQLNEELKKGYDIVRISRWASTIYCNSLRDLDEMQTDVLAELLRMEDDPQFEYSEQKLRSLATLLIQNEKDPIKHIHNMKLK